MAGDFNLVALLVALLGSAGVGGVVTSIINGVVMARKGISGREDKRRDDIIAQRDLAWQRANEAEAGERAADERADLERARRIQWQEQAVRQRLQLLMAGIEPLGNLPDEDTNPPRKENQ
jgi:hypothetical protein